MNVKGRLTNTVQSSHRGFRLVTPVPDDGIAWNGVHVGDLCAEALACVWQRVE